MNREIGAKIKEARKQAEMVQAELGAAIGVSATTICELEAGERKQAPSPSLMVSISDALRDTSLLHHYCAYCDLRKRIPIRKFKPMNNIVPGVLPSVMKNMQKINVGGERLQMMASKLLQPGFEKEPDFEEFRDEFVILLTDMRRGLEISLDQMKEANFLTDAHQKALEDVQQLRCEAKGYHIPTGAEG